jgi:hypothetical protein
MGTRRRLRMLKRMRDVAKDLDVLRVNPVAEAVTSADDIRVVCRRCVAPKPELVAKGAQYFVGKFVKKLFTEEHMWVFIDGFNGDVLTGTLDNEPVLMMILEWGDRVEVRLNEIEDVRDGNKCTMTETMSYLH